MSLSPPSVKPSTKGTRSSSCPPQITPMAAAAVGGRHRKWKNTVFESATGRERRTDEKPDDVRMRRRVVEILFDVPYTHVHVEIARRRRRRIQRTRRGRLLETAKTVVYN